MIQISHSLVLGWRRIDLKLLAPKITSQVKKEKKEIHAPGKKFKPARNEYLYV